jgi:uncharacterized membrane protein required for colicin V production
MALQYTVPQFIDVEDKIFGPITARQFIILLSAVGPLFITYKLADIALFIFVAVIVGGLAVLFAFVRINGQAFHYFILNIIQTARRPSRRLWYKSYTTGALQQNISDAKKLMKKEGETETIERKSISNTRIRDLSLLVNTGGYFKPE